MHFPAVHAPDLAGVVRRSRDRIVRAIDDFVNVVILFFFKDYLFFYFFILNHIYSSGGLV